MTGDPFLTRAIRTQILPAIWILTISVGPIPKSIALAAPFGTTDPTPRCLDHRPFERTAEQPVVGRTEAQSSEVCLPRTNSNLSLVPYTIHTTKGLVSEYIEPKYNNRYQKWKAELLRTQFGQGLWSKYWNNQQFALSIRIGPNPGGEHGAAIAGYHWNDKGHLNAATIILGPRVDSDYPDDDAQYPILASLRPGINEFALSAETVAAAKIAHEFGHIEVVAAISQRSFCLQKFLVPIWNRVFLSTGRVSQPEIERLMGGTPAEINAWHEVEAEAAGTVRFLGDRFPGKPGERMPGQVRRAIRGLVLGK